MAYFEEWQKGSGAVYFSKLNFILEQLKTKQCFINILIYVHLRIKEKRIT
jgi:hypothetical protein